MRVLSSLGLKGTSEVGELSEVKCALSVNARLASPAYLFLPAIS